MKKDELTPTDKLKDEEDQNKKDLPYNPDITKEDKQALNVKGHSMNMGQDKELANRERDVDFTGKERDVDFTGKEMDIPGREERDTSTGTGIPDEDNYQFNKRGSRPEEKRKSENPNPGREIPKD